MGLFFSFLLALTWIAVAGDAKAEGDDSGLTAYGAVALYNNPDYDSLVQVEFPFNIDRCELEFFRPDSTDPNYYARVFAQAKLFDGYGMAVDSAATYFSAVAPDLEQAARKEIRLFNSLNILARPGLYTARLEVIDAVSKRESSVFFDTVDVRLSDPGRLTLSGVRLAYLVARADTNAPGNPNIIKNGYTIYSNTQNALTIDDSATYIYGELYNLDYSADKASNYRVAFTVNDSKGELYRDFGYKLVRKPGTSSVIAERLETKDWPIGSYKIVVTATDMVTGQSDTVSVPLDIWPNAQQMAALAAYRPETVSSDPYDTLDIEHRVQVVKYLLDPSQMSILNGLSDAGKANYLDRYWKEHDEDPTTAVIENRVRMVRRYNHANEFFSQNVEHTDGWSTDLGRIYMMYGPAEQIEENPAPLDGKPYIIWWYHSIGRGLVFVFEDRFENHEFYLVHSNADGEIYSSEWEQLLKEGFISPY